MYIKRDVVGARALGKSKCHSDTRERRPHNRISVTIYSYVRLMVCDMFPTPQPPELAIYDPCSLSHFVTPPPTFRISVTAITSRSHRGDRGSTPRFGMRFHFSKKYVLFLVILLHNSHLSTRLVMEYWCSEECHTCKEQVACIRREDR